MQDLSSTEFEVLSRAINSAKPKQSPAYPGAGITKAQFAQLDPEPTSAENPMQDHLRGVKIEVEAVLGRTKMPLHQLLRLQPGSVISLDKLAGESIDIEANGKIIARGEAVVINDHFGIKITSLETGEN